MTASIRTRVSIPLSNGSEPEFVSFHGLSDGKEHLAVAFNNAAEEAVPLVRVHSECLTGDLFQSLRCDCGCQLTEVMGLLAKQGGILLYMRQEGRGIGLYNKLDAYKLQQEEGLDTYEANRRLGFAEDDRDYAVAADMLKAMNVSRIRILTNNPDKVAGLKANGVEIDAVYPTRTYINQHNENYLRVKQSQTRHTLEIG